MYSDRVLRASPIPVDDRELFTDFILLDMDEYEIILGMDQLSKYHAKIDYRKKIVVFHPPYTNQFMYSDQLEISFDFNYEGLEIIT